MRFTSNGDFAIHVTDITKAREFYGRVLGFELIDEGDGTLTYDTGAFTLYINEGEQVRPFIPSLDVESLDAARAHIQENGARVIWESPGHRSLYFEDPFGIVIDLIER
ncbi:MAG: VOC family protein [Anaerolineae bacterium]